MTDSMKGFWFVYLGNPGQVAYLAGRKRPIALCVEDALLFRRQVDAEEWIREHGPKWCVAWCDMKAVQY